jgi:hypothetical protein
MQSVDKKNQQVACRTLHVDRRFPQVAGYDRLVEPATATCRVLQVNSNTSPKPATRESRLLDSVDAEQEPKFNAYRLGGALLYAVVTSGYK